MTENLRKDLRKMIVEDPKTAIKTIEKEPNILEMLLNADEEADRERREKIKYVNMTMQMDQQLREKAKQLKTTQGVLIGAGILLLLSLLERE